MIIVEGYGSTSQGDIELEVLAYQPGPVPVLSPINACASPSVCISLANASEMPAGTSYNWTFSGDYSGTSSDPTPTLNLNNLSPGDVVNINVTITLPPPVWNLTCSPQHTTTTTLTIVPPASYSGGRLECNSCGNLIFIGNSFQLTVDPVNRPNGDRVILQVSRDSGATWTTIATNPTFPYTINIPLSTAEIGVRWYRVIALPNPGCPGDTSFSNIVSAEIIDRPGNRLANAIPITLTYDESLGRWSATVRDSTTGPGTTDEFNPAAGARQGRTSRALFYVLRLLACLDSLHLSTCGTFTNFDTYLHLINISTQDTIYNDDQGDLVPNCSFTRSYIKAIAGMDGDRLSETADTLRLASGDELVIVMEGFSGQGRFELNIEGYGPPPASHPRPNLGEDVTLCVSAAVYPLNVRDVNASAYEWLVNGQPINHQLLYYDLPLTPGEHEIIVRAIFRAAGSSSNGPICEADTTADTLRVTVLEDAAPPPPISLGPDTTICVSLGTYVLSVPLVADEYEWYVNGQLQAGISGNRFTLTFSRDTVFRIRVVARNNPLTGSPCASAPTQDEVVITVSPHPASSIQVDTVIYQSGQTHTITVENAAPSVTFQASSSVQGNSYVWQLYNPGSTAPNASGAGGSFNHTFENLGLHTLILISINGACRERDTLFIDV